MKGFLTAGLQVYHAKVEPGQLLVVPPGFLVARTAIGGNMAAGYRRAFLPASDCARAGFAVLRRVSKDDDSLSTLDSLVVALARQNKKPQ